MTQPYTTAQAVTPNDSEDIPGGKATGLFIGSAGSLAVILRPGTPSVVFASIAAGTMLDNIEVSRVLATGTTVASGILALR